MYDVIIIGAGVTGCAAAKELSRYQLRVCVLEREEDVCDGASKANSGLVHAGFDAKPGTLKAKMNVEGTARMEQLCKELDVPFKRTGALVIASDDAEKERLKGLYDQGIQNGVQELRILDSVQLKELEPNINENACAALFAPTAGIVCPFTLTIAMAENAATNGVEFFFENEVTSITRVGETYQVKTTQPSRSDSTIEKCYEGKVVINCAGVYSDVLHNMVSEQKYHITPRRGQYCLLDHEAGGHVNHTIFKVPGPMGKGILVTQTVHGNLLLGPTAESIEDRDGINTTKEGMEQVLNGVAATVRDIPIRQVITSFSGLRAHEDGGDFIIQEAPDAPGFIDAVGIESPGLSSAPAIGARLCELAVTRLQPKENPNYSPYRHGILNFLSLSEKEQAKLLKVRPEYGTIVCRCEMITEGEILDAIYRPLGARSLDAIKRRTRAGMGRCQSGFCSPKVVEILAQALHTEPTNITKAGTGAEILLGKTR